MVLKCCCGWQTRHRRLPNHSARKEKNRTCALPSKVNPALTVTLAVTALVGPQTLVPCVLSAQVFRPVAAGRVPMPPFCRSRTACMVPSPTTTIFCSSVRSPSSAKRRSAFGTPSSHVPGADIADIRQVLSHPVALNQCRRFFAAHAHLQPVPFYDTAGAAKHIAAAGDPTLAALAAPGAAAVYGGSILRSDLEDDSNNFTRFFLVAATASAEAVRSALTGTDGWHDRMCVAFAIPNRPGMLGDILSALSLRSPT